ncbi:unnamed protein product [Caenorhabditis brenneri]
MSITTYDNDTYLFPDSGESARYVLFHVFKWAQVVGFNSVQTEFYIAFFGVLLTSVHIWILTRKVMMTSSVISIMIGIAFFDMTSMVITIGTNHMLYGTEGSECKPPATLLSFRIFWFFNSVRDMVRRASTWLGVLMAFIRYTGLKFAMTPIFSKLSKPIFGVYAIIVSIVPSFILSVFYWLKYEIANSETQLWKPGEECSNYSPMDIRPVVSQKPSKLFTNNNGIVGKVFMLINGSISKIIPCILLPTLTILLIVELQNAKKVREKLNSQERGKRLLATYVNHMCNAMFTINSITHCLVFFIMSSQYRKTVRMVFGKPRRTSEVLTARSTIITTAKKSF